MANQFIARKGLISLSDAQITGSLSTSAGLIVDGNAATLNVTHAGASKLYYSNLGFRASTNITQITGTSSTDITLSGGFIKLTGGNVGIGTTSPDYLLELSGQQALFAIGRGNVGDTIWEMSADSATFFLKEKVLNEYKFIVKETGRVGIGGDSALTALHIQGATATEGIYINSGADVDHTIINMEGITGGGKLIWDDSEEAFSMTKGLRVTAGNVGIGVTSPSEKLHVDGDIKVNNGRGIRGEDGHERINFHTSNGIEIYTSNIERMCILADGNVGIGTTSPNDELEVKGNNVQISLMASADGSENAIVFRDDDGNADGAIKYRTDYSGQTDNYMGFYTDGNNERVRIDDDGKVFIGGVITPPGDQRFIVSKDAVTSQTHWQMMIQGQYDAGIMFGEDGGVRGKVGYDEGKGLVGIWDNNGTAHWATHYTSDYLVAETSDGERMRILSDGKVGIGVTAPSVNLDVYNSGGWGGIDVDGTSGGEVRLQKAGTIYGDIYASDSTEFVLKSPSGFHIMTNNAANSGINMLATNPTRFGFACASSATAAVKFGGTYPAVAGDANIGVFFNQSFTGTPNEDIVGIRHSPQMTEAGSGTHSNVFGMQISPTLNGAGAAVGNTAALYIAGAMAGGSNNYALWVDAGDVRIDGSLTVAGSVQGTTINNASNNRVMTSTGSEINCEANLVFDGTNLGIGVTSPASSLHIISPTAANSPWTSTAITFAPANYTARTWQLRYDDGGAVGNAFSIAAAGTRILYMTSAGRVGINTASPDGTLHVHEGSAGSVAAYAGSTLTLETNDANNFLSMLSPSGNNQGLLFGDAAANYRGQVQYNHTGDVMIFHTAAAERMRLGSNGGLSIGTTTATGGGGLLVDNDIVGNSRFGVGSGGNTSTPAIYLVGDTNTGIYWPSGGNRLGWVTDGGERMRLTATGKLGLGTTSPTYKLEVVGTFCAGDASDSTLANANHLLNSDNDAKYTAIMGGAITSSTFGDGAVALKIFPHGSGARTAGEYGPAISLYHLDPNTYGATYGAGAAAAISLKLYDTPGAERSRLVFLINSSTSTGSNPNIEALSIEPTAGNATFAGDIEMTGTRSLKATNDLKLYADNVKMADFWLSGADEYVQFTGTTKTVDKFEQTGTATNVFGGGATFASGNVGIGTTSPSYGLHVSSATAANAILSIDNTNNDASGGSLYLKNTRTGQDNDESGRIYFWGEDDAGNAHETVMIIGTMVDASNGSEDTMLRMYTYVNGSQQNTLKLQGKDATLLATGKLYLDGGTHTYLSEGSADTLDIFAGGNHALRLTTASVQIGPGGDHDLMVWPTKKLYLDAGGNTYFVESSADVVRLYTGGTSRMQWQSDGVIIPATNKLYLDGGGDTYLYENSGNSAQMVVGGSTSWFFNAGGGGVVATDKIYLDGGSNTYITEASADVMKFYAGGNEMWRLTSTYAYTEGDLAIDSSKKFYLDGIGNTYIHQNVADKIGFVAGGTQSLTATASGVGIGNTDPKALLHAKAAANNWEDGLLLEHNSGDTGWNIKAENDGDNALWFGYNADTSTSFAGQSATARMVIHSDGNVGIGTTAPTNLLTVKGATDKWIWCGTISTGEIGFQTHNDANNAYVKMGFNALSYTWNVGSNPKMVIDGSGKVGIGTTSPGEKLSVAGHIEIKSGSWLILRNNANDNYSYIQNADTGSEIQFATSGVKMVLDSAGKLGIGTTSPGSVLHLLAAANTNAELKICTDDNEISRLGLYEDAAGTAHGAFFQYRGESSDVLQIGSINSGTDSVYITMTDAGNVTFTGTVTVSGNIVGKSDHTTELGHYSDGLIKRIRMSQGGELIFGDSSTSNPCMITEGVESNFTDQDYLSIYARNKLQFYGYSGGKTLWGNWNSTGLGIKTTSPATDLDISCTSGGLKITNPGSGWLTGIHTINTYNDASPSMITLEKIRSGTTADNDYVGGVLFRGRNDAGEAHNVVEQYGMWIDASNGSETTKWHIGTWGAGTEYPATLTARGGKVGVGTANPTQAFEVSGAGDVFSRVVCTSSGNARLRLSAYDTNDLSGIEFERQATAVGSIRYVHHANYADERMEFMTNGNSTTAMVIKGGNVGIGTTSPNATLNVNGSLYMGSSSSQGVLSLDSASANNNAFLRFMSAGTAKSSLGFHGGMHGGNSTILKMYQYAGTHYHNDRMEIFTTGGDIHFGPGDSMKMIVTEWGGVGIGTPYNGVSGNLHVERQAINGDCVLHVEGPSSGGDPTIRMTSGNNRSALIKFENPTGSTYGQIKFEHANLGTLRFRAHNASTDDMTIAETVTYINGSLGVGTTSPEKKLHVKGAGSVIGLMETTSYNACYLMFQDNTSTNEQQVRVGSAGNDLKLWAGDNIRVTIDAAGDLTVHSGDVNASGSKNFKIDHPLLSKTDTHDLVHASIEGPRADLQYRGVVTLSDGIAIVNLDTAAGMTEGTWNELCRDPQVWLQNDTGWDAVRGSVSGNTLTINCQDSGSTDTISWMAVAERKDPTMISSQNTDSEGRLIVEPEK